MQRGVNRTANLARTKGADSFVDGNDAAHLHGIHLFAGKHFNLGIDHFAARGTQLIDFDFTVQDELLAGLQASFQITAVKKLAGQRAGIILNEEMIDGIAAVHAANSLAAHDAGAQGVGAVGLNVLDFGEMDAVFVAEGQIVEQIFEREDAALGEEFGALRPDAFHHADVGLEGDGHRSFFISLLGQGPLFEKLALRACVSLEWAFEGCRACRRLPWRIHD